MKTVRPSWALLLALGLAMRTACADAPTASDLTNPETSPYGLYLRTDADGTPLTVLHPNLAPLPTKEADALQQIATAQAEDKNWLTRIYAQRMQMRASAHDADGYFWQELSANRDLQRLAGINYMEADKDKDEDKDKSASPETATTRPGILHPPSASALGANTGSLVREYNFKPLVAPTPMYNSMQGLYASEAAGSQPDDKPVLHTPAAGALRPVPGAAPNADDIQTPGLIAAKASGVPDLGSPDLTLDLLPGESLTQAAMDRANEQALALPQPTSMEQPTGRGPGATTNAVAQPSVPMAKVAKDPEDNPNAPMPVSRQPIIVPGHPQPQSPFFMFNH